MKVILDMKDFTGFYIYSASSCCQNLNGKMIDKTIRKAFPDDNESTLYVVKVNGVNAYQQLYEDEMYR